MRRKVPDDISIHCLRGLFINSRIVLLYSRKNEIENYFQPFICTSKKGKAIGLPDDFLALKEGSKGGGVIQVNLSFNSF